MDGFEWNSQFVANFVQHLKKQERASSTIEKYIRDICAFEAWLGNRTVNKEVVIGWKGSLLEKGYVPLDLEGDRG